LSLHLYIDHNVHAGITRGLRQREIDCLTADEDGRSLANDDAILLRATELQRVVFTQDIDFVELASRFIKEGRNFSGVIYARQMGTTIGAAIRDLELMSTLLNPEEMINQVEWIPLR
jgi:predicted nuclease of predicted toxin-antitoxin system